jgi:hypothetical protein
MRSCTEKAYPGGLRVLVLLLCLGAVWPWPAGGSTRRSTRVRQYEAPAAWGTDLDEAVGRARASMKPILVFFTAPDCPACHQIKRFSLNNAALQPVIRKFERVEIDLSKRSELVSLFNIDKLPGLYVIDPDGRIKGHMEGYATAKALGKYLGRIVADHWSALEIDRLITALATGQASADQWRKGLSAMDNSDIRHRMLALSERLSPGDIKTLTACLGHGQLAVRLGALDLLEQVNDTIIGFDPWGDPQSGEQQDLLKRWRQWADSGESPSALSSELTREKFDRRIQDLIGDDPQRSRRALQVLGRGGQHAARFIVDYFQAHPTLDTNALRRIKEVQYALVIPASNGLDPQATAHRIVWGNPDVQIRTIRQLTDCGMGPSAILVDLLAHEDPLVRETAVEILFKTAGALAVAPVKKLLEQEKDPDVSFAALKHLSDTKTAESQRILQSYFTHDNEDLVIAAIEGAVELSAGPMGAKLLPLLEDPRWRVRAAAIEGIKKKGGLEAGPLDRLRGKEMQVPDRVAEALGKCLEDPDEFVRHTAAAALGELKVDNAEGPLKKAYDRYPDMHGVVVSVLMRMGKSMPSSFIDGLFGPEPEDLLFVMDNIREINGSSRELIRRAAASKNPDISGSALRIIAGSDKRQASDNALLISALQSGQTEKQLTILQEFDLDSEDTKRVREQMQSAPSPGKGRARPSGDTHTDVLLAATGLMEDPSTSELVRGQALLLLNQYGYPDAFKKAMETWPELNASTRTAVIRFLPLYGKDSIPLFRRALDDDYTDVWQTALGQFYDDDGHDLYAGPLGDYLLEPAGRLTSSMMWPEGLYRLCSEKPRALIPFARKTLSAPDTVPSDRKILALTVYALTGVPQGGEPPVLALTRDKNPFIRRAAWIALTAQSREALEKHFETMQADPSSRVRELLPALIYNHGYGKTPVALYFSKEEYFTGYQGLRIEQAHESARSYGAPGAYPYGTKKTIRPAVTDKIRTMMVNDPDPLVRFRCMLCLLSHKIPLDLGEVVTTARLSGQPKRVADLLEEFFNIHGSDLGEPFKVLLPLLQTPDGKGGREYMVESFLSRWGGRAHPPGETRISFTTIPSPSPSKSLMATFNDGYEELSRQNDSPIEMVLFTTSGCRRCFAVEKYIQMLRHRYPNLRVRRHDILTRRGLAYNEVLSRKFMAEDTARGKAPAVFTAGGYAIDRNITLFSLEKLVRYSAMEITGEGPLAVSPEELAVADGFIRARRTGLSWYGVARAGLVRGANPLAMAALLLVFYYLRIAGRTGPSVMRYGTLYVATAAVVTLSLWLLPQGDIAKGTRLHDISGVLMWLILMYMVSIGLRFFFRSLWRLKKKAKSKTEKPKTRKIPGRRYVLGVVALWAVVLAVLDIPAMGNSQTVTLVYSIKNQISLFPSMLMLILFFMMSVLPSGGLLWSFSQLTRREKIQSFVAGHPFSANMALSAVWIWIAVKYFQAL